MRRRDRALLLAALILLLFFARGAAATSGLEPSIDKTSTFMWICATGTNSNASAVF